MSSHKSVRTSGASLLAVERVSLPLRSSLLQGSADVIRHGLGSGDRGGWKTGIIIPVGYSKEKNPAQAWSILSVV